MLAPEVLRKLSNDIPPPLSGLDHVLVFSTGGLRHRLISAIPLGIGEPLMFDSTLITRSRVAETEA